MSFASFLRNYRLEECRKFTDSWNNFVLFFVILPIYQVMHIRYNGDRIMAKLVQIFTNLIALLNTPNKNQDKSRHRLLRIQFGFKRVVDNPYRTIKQILFRLVCGWYVGTIYQNKTL